jgi:hypothetical protein
VDKTITEKARQETRDFYPVVQPSDTCLLPRCGVPMDEGCTQPLSSDPMTNFNTMAFFLIILLPFARNLHKLEPLALTIKITKKAQECVEAKCGSLRMLSECLSDSFIRLWVPFIAPRQLGAVGGKLGRPTLPSVGWCTGQSGAPPDSYCSCPVLDFFPYGEQSTVGPRNRLAHQTLSGAYRTIRCAQPTVGATTCRTKIARPTVGAGDRWFTGQSGELQPRRPDAFPESDEFAADDSPNSLVHHRTVR